MNDMILDNYPLMYRIESNGTVPYRILKEVDSNYVVVPDGIQTMASKSQFYDKKFDAQYTLLLQRLDSGVNFSNYKSSPYYKDYIERLQKENPEYLI